MGDNQVSLYECIYSMELFKKHFVSEKVLNHCMGSLARFYKEKHAHGEIVGNIDIKKFLIDLEDGEISIEATGTNEETEGIIDFIKLLPPEVLKKSDTFGISQDKYTLAILLFALRYFAFPFDGKRWYKAPITTSEQAVDFYSNPIFVFDIINDSNSVSMSTSSVLVQGWQEESNEKIKDLFTTCFTAGISGYDMRPSEDIWLEALGISCKKTLFMVIDDKKIQLSDGVEIYKGDLQDGGSSNKKVAVVLRSKKNDDILALGNASDDTWSVYMPDSREVMVAPKNVAPLVEGSTLSIGDLLVNIVSEER